MANDWTLDPAIQSELSDKWYDQPDVVAGIKLNMQTLPFDSEGSEYDYETAKQKGLDPKDIVRQDLYPGEDKYFKENPNVGGMMTEDNRVIINPYSKLTDKEKDAVRINETLRLNFKQDNVVPNIEISEKQRSFFKGTPYENDENAIKQTIMARILTGDPSAKATEEQLNEAETDLFKAYKENIDHWGSVVPASDEDKLKYNLPKESYLLVKGKQHKTWDKAIQGEADRGFRVKKFGDRYFSIPGEINTEGKDVEAGASDDVYKNYILSWEGDFFPEAKKATEDEKELTIGYGHYGEDVKPGQTITREEADVLLDKDIQKRMPAIMKAIPNFNTLSENLRKNIVSSWYRGSLSGSPKTIELINQGKFKEAAKEFLDNDEYRNAEKRNRSGIKSRMKATSKALAGE